MMAGRDGSGVGSARRRRDRRSAHGVDGIFVAALHHSAQRVEERREEAGREQHHVSRRPKPLPLGTGPQGAAVAAGAPLLVVPSLRGVDGVSGTTVSYLLKVALEKKKEDDGGSGRRRSTRRACRFSTLGERQRAAHPCRVPRMAQVGRPPPQREEEEEEEEGAEILFLSVLSSLFRCSLAENWTLLLGPLYVLLLFGVWVWLGLSVFSALLGSSMDMFIRQS